MRKLFVAEQSRQRSHRHRRQDSVGVVDGQEGLAGALAPVHVRRLGEQAEAAELAARQRAYASDMNVAKQQLDGNNLGRALELLKKDYGGEVRCWEEHESPYAVIAGIGLIAARDNDKSSQDIGIR